MLEVPRIGRANRPQEVADALLQRGIARIAKKVLTTPTGQLILLYPSESLINLGDNWHVLILPEKTLYVYIPRVGLGIEVARRLVAKAHTVGKTLPWPDEHQKVNDMGSDIPPAIRQHLHY